MSANETPATTPELRYAVVPFRAGEFRDAKQTGDGSFTITGHAAVFDQETVLYDLGWLRVREVIQPGAFRNALSRNPLVHLNVGHDMNRAIASSHVSGVGGLELSEDDEGLRTFARVTPDDPDVQAVSVKMRYGYVNQMSFAFTVAKSERLVEEDEDGNEDVLRTIIEIGDLYDVCVCAQGAYPQTSAELAMRSLASMLGRGSTLPGQPEHRSQPQEGAEPTVAPTETRTADDQEVVDAAKPEAGESDTPRAASAPRHDANARRP
jgi:HK97 family phage prohead protease